MLQQFMRENYQSLQIDDNLWGKVRFKQQTDLAAGIYQFSPNFKTYNEQMFKVVLTEVELVCERLFTETDDVYLVLNKAIANTHQKQQKVLPLILKNKQRGAQYSNQQILAETDGSNRQFEQISLETKWQNIKRHRLFKSLSNQDFPDRRPQFKANNLYRPVDVYLINQRSKIIFHMYDDRGYELYFPDSISQKVFEKKQKN